MASEYAFDTTRKAAQLAASLVRTAGHVTVADPGSFRQDTSELVDRLHAPGYVRAVRTGEPAHLAESQGFDWDPKVPVMAVAHSTGLVAAVTEVLTGPALVAGSLSSGLHHARRDRGAGFCTFNGLAVAAARAFDLGAERILVLDLDAHCGGGTRSMTDPATVVQIDVATVPYDRWTPVGADALVLADAGSYLSSVCEALDLADRAGTFDLVLYNAGMDPANSGVCREDLERREQMVAEWAKAGGRRLVFALAGGYSGGGITMADLVGLHTLTVDAFS